MATEPTTEFVYAFEWFKYHAEQRYRAVTLYIIQLVVVPLGGAIAGLIAINSGQKIDDSLKILILSAALLISFLGILFSVIFYILDLRNSELVKIGEKALRYHEITMSEQCKIFHIKDEDAKEKIQTHGFMFKCLFIVGGTAYFGTALIIVVLLAMIR